MSTITKIQFTIEEEEEDEEHAIDYVLAQLKRKIIEQMNRAPGCICTKPESADTIKNINGVTIGTIEVTKFDTD
jgi:hypothetical protein